MSFKYTEVKELREEPSASLSPPPPHHTQFCLFTPEALPSTLKTTDLSTFHYTETFVIHPHSYPV